MDVFYEHTEACLKKPKGHWNLSDRKKKYTKHLDAKLEKNYFLKHSPVIETIFGDMMCICGCVHPVSGGDLQAPHER